MTVTRNRCEGLLSVLSKAGGRTLVGVAGAHADVANVSGLHDVVQSLHLRKSRHQSLARPPV